MSSIFFHPLVVHFPIALLTVYSVMELVRWRHLTALPFWHGTKAVLVILGSLATFVALESGEEAAEAFSGGAALRRVIVLHSTWANVTAWIYGIIAVLYLLTLLQEHGYLAAFLERLRGRYQTASEILRKVAAFATRVSRGLWMVPLSLAGLIAVTITGALGGSMVYGPTADPVIAFVYNLFGL
ncbi:MAG: hypothetical protein WC817_00730 [Patescibacteria group bacterium]|jgi:uncharacterized membrane protein